jgi:hypothetical protein
MDLSPFVSPDPATRRDGWSPERKLRFLDRLAARGNVRAASAAVGMSREAAYTLRRRDPLFARGWAAALVLARESSAEVLADKAIDGIEEEVWYRGEHVGTRRRYDARLLLAHLARLDRMIEQEQDRAAADAARFDEILACIAGAEAPVELADGEDPLPLDRESALDEAECKARTAAERRWAAREADSKDGLLSDEEYAGHLAALETGAASARAKAGVKWDAWFERACAAVDDLLGRSEAEPGDESAGDPPGSPPPDVAQETPAPDAAACSPGTVSEVSGSRGGARFVGPDGRR